jgi:hypothetical protein
MDWAARVPFLTEALVLLCSYLLVPITSSGNHPGSTVDPCQWVKVEGILSCSVTSSIDGIWKIIYIPPTWFQNPYSPNNSRLLQWCMYCTFLMSQNTDLKLDTYGKWWLTYYLKSCSLVFIHIHSLFSLIHWTTRDITLSDLTVRHFLPAHLSYKT